MRKSFFRKVKDERSKRAFFEQSDMHCSQWHQDEVTCSEALHKKTRVVRYHEDQDPQLEVDSPTISSHFRSCNCVYIRVIVEGVIYESVGVSDITTYRFVASFGNLVVTMRCAPQRNSFNPH